ncbi:hypothetical protein HK101_004250 [Irineochytrium annulatum]|nr:hypothetical protein HK101_004250 [Irineochytrium annulatum]
MCNGDIEDVTQIIEPHGKCDINCVSWCPLEGHGDLLASAGDDGSIKVWIIERTPLNIPFGTCISVGGLFLWALTFAGTITQTSVLSLIQVTVLIACYVATDYGDSTGFPPAVAASNFLWSVQACILVYLELDRLERFVLRTNVARYLVRAFAVLVCLTSMLMPIYSTAVGDPMVLLQESRDVLTAASILTCAFDMLCDLLVIRHILTGAETNKWKVASKQACALVLYVGALAFCESWNYLVDPVSGLQLWATVDVAAVFSYMCMYRVLLDAVNVDRAALTAGGKQGKGSDKGSERSGEQTGLVASNSVAASRRYEDV